MNELGNSETSYFIVKEPEEQKKARLEEAGKVKEGIRLLEDIIARFDKRIAFYDSLDSMDVDAMSKPEDHLRQVIANKQTKANLIAEREYLYTLRTSFK